MSGSSSSRVCVVTPTLPARSELLRECRESVAAQTVPCDHLVAVDEFGAGPSRVRNALAARTDADWLLFLDDDDLLDPECVEVLLDRAGEADVAYPFCRVEGKPDWSPNRLHHADTLLRFNYIPVVALVRAEAFRAVGGFRPLPQFEDWDLWKRMLAAGLRFRCVPEVLWTYRILASGESRNEWQQAA